MKSSTIVFISLVALALIIVIGFFITVPEIEEDLFERTKQALIAEDIDFDNISFDGQEAILTGTIGSQDEKDQIENIVVNVPGVASVSNNILVQDPIAVIIRANGETIIMNATSGKSINAKSGIRLVDGDKITTSKSGRIELRFLDDNSLIRIRPNSSCSINAKKEKFSMVKNIIIEVGSIFSRITKQKSLYKVTTPTSVAAVKGTSFWTSQKLNGTTSFLGEEGVVEIRNDAGVVLMKAGEMCTVTSKNSKMVVEKVNLPNAFIKMVGDSKIIFDQSGFSLNQKQYNLLNKVKEFMDQYPSARLEIEGYTDSPGNFNANLILSEQRAKAVMEYLVTKGIDPERLNAKGFGEKYPLANNSYPDGRRKNRRVELKVKENK